MTKLTRLQTALVEQAMERADGALLPAPETLSATELALNRALSGLVRRGLAARMTTPGEEGDAVGPLFLTDAGRTALAAADEGATGGDATTRLPQPTPPGGKLGAVLKAIGRKRGATLAELTEATGWQPHTTRAALTRLRQRGFPATLTEEGGRKAYRLEG